MLMPHQSHLMGLPQSEVNSCPTSGLEPWLGWKTVQTWAGVGVGVVVKGLASTGDMCDFNQRVVGSL